MSKNTAEHPRIGVHISIGKGLPKAAENAIAWGAEACQIFARNPRGAAARQWPQEEIDAFRALSQGRLDPVVVHIPYIVNPASEKADLYELAERIITEDLQRCDLIGARCLVLHPGSHGASSPEQAIERLTALINRVTGSYTGETMILIETMSGMGKEIGASIPEISAIMSGFRDSDRTGICLDTCHMLGAGFDMVTAEGINATAKMLDGAVGIDRIKLIHINDSKREMGSRVDRHAPIGTGFIGLEGMKNVMSHPVFGRIPSILETPEETIQEDIKALKTIRASLGA